MGNDEQEITRLIGRAQRRDAAALDQIVDAYGPRLYGYLYRLTGSRDDAEDLLQEVFLRVVRTIGEYQHDGRFDGWLFRIATNLVRDRIRRARRARPVQSLDLPGGEIGDGRDAPARARGGQDEYDSPDGPVLLREQIDALQRALARLGDAEREVIMLRHFGELSFAEIANVMGTPLGTALARAHRGLAKLREWLSADD